MFANHDIRLEALQILRGSFFVKKIQSTNYHRGILLDPGNQLSSIEQRLANVARKQKSQNVPTSSINQLKPPPSHPARKGNQSFRPYDRHSVSSPSNITPSIDNQTEALKKSVDGKIDQAQQLSKSRVHRLWRPSLTTGVLAVAVRSSQWASYGQ